MFKKKFQVDVYAHLEKSNDYDGSQNTHSEKSHLFSSEQPRDAGTALFCDDRNCEAKHADVTRDGDISQATRSRGSFPAKIASRLSSARNPMASLVSFVALPICGIRNTLGSCRYPG